MKEKLILELQKGIFKWYPFEKDAQVLYLGSSSTSFFTEANWQEMGNYDYIVAVHSLEEADSPQNFLCECKKHLKDGGKLLLAVDNRFGLRYFCGDRDPYTDRNFDGIENYRHVSGIDSKKQIGHVYDADFVENAIRAAGFKKWHRFSVLPNIDAAQLLYEQDYIPQEDLAMRYFPLYNHADTVFLEEQFLYEDLIKNHMFHQMANGYLFECTVEGNLTNMKHVTLSMDRGEESAMATMFDDGHKVYKKAVYPQGISSLELMQNNHEDLKNHGVLVVEGVLKEDVYETPYIDEPLANVYLQNLLRKDKEAFILEVDKLRDLILQSSEHVEPVLSDYEKMEIIEDAPIQNGVWLARGYFDLVPLNAFYVNGEYVFFDQEFCIENYPANAILIRTVDIIYGAHRDLEEILPRVFFWKRYDVEGQVDYLRKKSGEFLYKLRNKHMLRSFYEAHASNYGLMHSNRQRMNYSAEEYQKIFVNIFDGLDRYKVLVFGSGLFAKKFLDLYGKRYEIEAILDNNADKWGMKMNGISICSPSILDSLDTNEYKVIICIKSYLGVLEQLKTAGVKHIGVYDINTAYIQPSCLEVTKKVSCAPGADDTKRAKKRYHTGYIAGVFDLYHIGHLNMFKRAKEQCEYLIVGVVSDEAVRKNKRTTPFIPFEERIEMVRSCKYVDEAVEIPYEYAGTKDAYRLYHFDVQFSGSDYENDPAWLAEREFLRKQGADLVFFPYTEQTSSSKIKALINKQLEE